MGKTRKRERSNRNKKMQRQKQSRKGARSNTQKYRVYKKSDFNSGDGMLTSVWGPSLWHYLHTMSFNYPVKPTQQDKKHYKAFILSLQNVLPCKYCRENLKNNLKKLPLTQKDLKSRDAFSRYIYKLHEHVNAMLGKKSGLKFCDVRERYEHFRSRCTIDLELKKQEFQELLKSKAGTKSMAKTRSKTKSKSKSKTQKKSKKEKGCTEPLYGKKSKCVIKIVPHDEKCKTFQMDDKCVKRKDM
jgi:hypothetical protein